MKNRHFIMRYERRRDAADRLMISFSFWHVVFQGAYLWIQPRVFQGRKVPWNKGTSIIISFTTHERKTLQRKMSDFFLLRTRKNRI